MSLMKKTLLMAAMATFLGVVSGQASAGAAATSAVQQTAVKKSAAKKTSTSLKAASAKSRQVKTGRAVKTSLKRRTAYVRPSEAMKAGLRQTVDPLRLGSSVALAVDVDNGEMLYGKNADVALPIASITKLMTALVIAESDVKLEQKIKITRDDYVRSHASSKLRSGMTMTRKAVLQAALMSSDNRAAHALARTYPGGIKAFVKAMNEKAAALGMSNAFFADPTGLDNRNHATAADLAKLVAAAARHDVIGQLSTTAFAKLKAGGRLLSFHTTNRLIGDPSWSIDVQKTGFTSAAGRCMVVQTAVGERQLALVVLDSPNNNQRAQDMRTMRAYVASETSFERRFGDAVPYALF